MAIRRSVRQGAAAAVLVVLLNCLTAGCAHSPVRRVEGYTPAAGEKAAITATGMIGRPYRYRGDSPEGFDCSGLVQYSYLTVGVVAPHGTRELMGVTRSVGSLRDARPGDLLFFSQEGKRQSCMGCISKWIHNSSPFIRYPIVERDYVLSRDLYIFGK